MTKTLQNIAHQIDRLNEGIGRAVSWLTLAMVLITFLIVLLRYLFDLGSIALQESVSYLHCMVFMLGISWTLKNNGHVRVDIIYQRCQPKRRALLDLMGTVLLLMPVSIFIFYTSLDYVANSWSQLESSREAGGLPGVFLLKTLIPVAATLLFLQGISLICRAILVITESETREDKQWS
jgi:TRAP-type mannitol/chloroaromatic compound transport system permease small subunit